MQVSTSPNAKATEINASDHIQGHHPGLFKGQKSAIISILQKRSGEWVPCYELANVALRYSARIKELRDSGFVIESKTHRVAGKVHGAFRLVACPGEPSEGL